MIYIVLTLVCILIMVCGALEKSERKRKRLLQRFYEIEEEERERRITIKYIEISQHQNIERVLNEVVKKPETLYIEHICNTERSCLFAVRFSAEI